MRPVCPRCHRVIDPPEAPRSFIPVRKTHETILLPVDWIVAAVAEDKGIVYHLRDGTSYFEWHTLLEMLLAGGDQVFQIHRNAVVRLDAILRLHHPGEDDHRVELITGLMLNVSRRSWVALKDRLGVRWIGKPRASRARHTTPGP